MASLMHLKATEAGNKKNKKHSKIQKYILTGILKMSVKIIS